MKSGLIEIHPEDGFLGGEIRFRISRSIGKSGFRFSKSKSGFPNRTHPFEIRFHGLSNIPFVTKQKFKLIEI